MGEDFKACLEDLEKVDCKKYAAMLLKMMAALTNSIDECTSGKTKEMIVNRFKALIKSEKES